jgi:hypothetical protein
VSVLIGGLIIVTFVFGTLYFYANLAYVNSVRNYQDLLDNYNELVAACNSTNMAFGWIGKPLEQKVTPSVDELRLWLQDDTTNEYEYSDEDFDCLHYALTLKIHGRAQHYDLGVVALHGYVVSTGRDWFHALNAIISSEGLVYVEPQLDIVWYLENYSEITCEEIYNIPGFGTIYLTDIKIIFDY